MVKVADLCILPQFLKSKKENTGTYLIMVKF